VDVYQKGKANIWAGKTKSSFEDFKVYGPDIEGLKDKLLSHKTRRQWLRGT